MPADPPPRLDDAPPPAARPSTFADDLAYLIPMGTFLVLTQIGVWWGGTYPYVYVAKTFAVAILLAIFWKRYTAIRWSFWPLGVALGVIGVVQWVGMQLWLQGHVAWFKPPDAAAVFNPERDIPSPALRWAFVGVRLAGATLVVPVMEELFWRDYLWRRVIAPNDFKLAAVGEWDAKAFALVPLLFAAVHGNWWLTAVGWGFLIGGLLAFTRSLGACIAMHAVTNLLLGLYVLRYRDWAFW